MYLAPVIMAVIVINLEKIFNNLENGVIFEKKFTFSYEILGF
jgi:hypothetical protein